MKLDKKQFIVFVLVIAFVLALVLTIYFSYQKPKIIPEEEIIKKEKTVVEKQLEELEALRQETGSQIYSKEELQKQLEELNKLRTQ